MTEIIKLSFSGGKISYPASRTRGLKTTMAATNSLPVVTSPSPTMLSPTSPIQQNVLDQPVNSILNITTPSTSKARDKNIGNKNVKLRGKQLLSPNNFNTINTSADFKLPAEIFASDDSVSDAGVTPTDEFSVKNATQDSMSADPVISISKDEMLGGLNIKIEKPIENVKLSKKTKKSKDNKTSNINLADIKTELQDDFDWNNMTLATVNSNTNVNRLQTV